MDEAFHVALISDAGLPCLGSAVPLQRFEGVYFTPLLINSQHFPKELALVAALRPGETLELVGGIWRHRDGQDPGCPVSACSWIHTEYKHLLPTISQHQLRHLNSICCCALAQVVG